MSEASYVLPGDSILIDSESLVLGPGLIMQNEDSIISTKAGILHSKENETKWFVESNQRRVGETLIDN